MAAFIPAIQHAAAQIARRPECAVASNCRAPERFMIHVLLLSHHRPPPPHHITSHIHSIIIICYYYYIYF